MLLSRVPHRRLGLDAHAGAHKSAESGAGRCVPRLFRALHVVCCMPNVACRTLCCMDNPGSASPCWHLPDAGMMSCAASVWYPGMISCSARSCMLRGVRHSAVCCMRSMLQRTRLCAACLVCAQDSRTTQGQICSRWDEVTKQRCAYACVRDYSLRDAAGGGFTVGAAYSWYLPSAGEGEAAHPVGHARLHPSRRQPPNDASPRVSPAHAERD